MVFEVEESAVGQRLDLFCVNKLPHLSRSFIQKAIKAGQIKLNGQLVKPRQFLGAGDKVEVDVESPVAVAAQEMVPVNLSVIFEDQDILVINKPAGIAMHDGLGSSPTVAQWFTQKYPEAIHVGEDETRPGIVHRLDKDTSGAIVLAKTAKAYDALKRQFEQRHAKKEYLALVFGVPGGPDGRINRPLKRSKRNPMRRTIDEAGKPAVTEWRLEKAFGRKLALLRLYPLTGRMHQLRAHLHWFGYPIVGDKLYTYKRQRPPQGVVRQLLHAESLTIDLPSGPTRTFIAPLPADFQAVLDQLNVVQ